MSGTSPSSSRLDGAVELRGWDSIEFWVGNARAFAGFLMSGFGFVTTAYAGPETGASGIASYVLEQGAIRLVVTSAQVADHPIAEHVRVHGDGVHDLAWIVDDAARAFEVAVARGARAVRPPWTEHDERGDLELAQIATYGETRHTFVNRSRWTAGTLAPHYRADDLPPAPLGPPVGLERVDHVVGNVERGELDRWVQFYEQVLGFTQLRHFDADQIRTEYSALVSTVVTDGHDIVMPLNEPADGLRRSQIQEYLDTYGGPGVQHLALRTGDIVAAVEAMKARGVRFMHVPDDYYDDAKQRLAGIDLPWDAIQRLGILTDIEPDGVLLQIFTETLTDRPTVFFEIIERRGAAGFGEGNFKALFEAIEHEQDRRGNL